MARQLGQAAARLRVGLVTTRSSETLFAQAERIKAIAWAVGGVDAYSTAFGQAIDAVIVAVQAAADKHALWTKAGVDSPQAFTRQDPPAVVAVLMRTV